MPNYTRFFWHGAPLTLNMCNYDKRKVQKIYLFHFVEITEHSFFVIFKLLQMLLSKLKEISLCYFDGFFDVFSMVSEELPRVLT